MENVLKKIISKKKEKLKNYKKIYSTTQLLNNVKSISNFINFKKEIIKRNLEKKISIILVYLKKLMYFNKIWSF